METSFVKQEGPLPEWPKIMISKDEDLLIMFSGPSTGMIIACNNEPGCVGEYCNTWEMNEFVPFTGSITIKAVEGR